MATHEQVQWWAWLLRFDYTVAAAAGAEGAEFAARSTRSGQDLCSQVRLFSNTSTLITTHGQQLANSIFLPRGAMLIEIYPSQYQVAENDDPSMFYWQNRDSGIHHHVLRAYHGDRNTLAFNVTEALHFLEPHLHLVPLQ